MLEHLSHTNFVGVSGPVQFEGADRSGIINIYQFRGNSSILVGQYLPDRNISQRTQLNESQILWMTGKKPTDGLQGELETVGVLTHWGLVTPFGDIDLGQHWLR